MIHRIRSGYLSNRITHLVFVMETQCVFRELGAASLKYHLYKYVALNIYIKLLSLLSFEILTVVATQIAVFYHNTPCSEVFRLFGGEYRSHLQGRKVRCIWRK
jgi:hypothetical protein